MSAHPETTVVIRAFNEEKHLPALLARLEQQQYRDFETVVVDSGSFDHTRDIAVRAGARLIALDRSQFTFGHALNVGIEAGVGRYVAIVSAHTVPSSDSWLERLVAPLARPDVAMVYGRQLGAPESKFSEAQDFRRTFGTAPAVLVPPHYFANNANAAVRRDLWEQEPFDPTLPGLEDAAWARSWMSRGFTVVYEPAAALYHIHEESWAQVRRRYYREAVAARRIGLKRRRSVLTELQREIGHLAGDLAVSAAAPPAGAGALARRLAGIVAFRANKTAGSIRGLLDGKALEDLKTRDAIYFDRSYAAVVIEGPHRAALRQRQLPPVSPADVIIRVAYVGVCGTDLEIHEGSLGYFKTGLGTYPIVPGHEMSGYVAARGANVTDLAEGDPVVVECIQGCGVCGPCRNGNAIGCDERRELGVLRRDGGYAEYVVVPRRFIHRLPEGTDMAAAALCEPLAVVLKGIERVSSALTSPRRCAVVGGGPIGRLCAMVLDHMSHTVTLIDRDPSRRTDLPGRVAGADAVAAASACDLIVEASGNVDALRQVLASSRAGATILLLGFPYAEQSFNFENVVAYDKAIIGSVGSGSQHFARAIELLGQLDTAAFAQHILPLTAFSEAWGRHRRRDCLKILLRPESPA